MRLVLSHLAGISLCLYVCTCARLDESQGKLNQELRLESQEIISSIEKIAFTLDSIRAQNQAWTLELDTLEKPLNPIHQEHQLSLLQFGELLDQEKKKVQAGPSRMRAYQDQFLDRHARKQLSNEELLEEHQHVLVWYEKMQERFEQIQETLKIMQDAHVQLFE